MKKLLALLLAALLVFSLVACGSDSKKDDEDEDEKVEEKEDEDKEDEDKDEDDKSDKEEEEEEETKKPSKPQEPSDDDEETAEVYECYLCGDEFDEIIELEDFDVQFCEDCFELFDNGYVCYECDEVFDEVLNSLEVGGIEAYFCDDCYDEYADEPSGDEEVYECYLCGDECDSITIFEDLSEDVGFCDDCAELIEDGYVCYGCVEVFDEVLTEAEYEGMHGYVCDDCYEILFGDEDDGSDSDDLGPCERCGNDGYTEYEGFVVCSDCYWDCYVCDGCGELTDEYEFGSDGNCYCPECYEIYGEGDYGYEATECAVCGDDSGDFVNGEIFGIEIPFCEECHELFEAGCVCYGCGEIFEDVLEEAEYEGYDIYVCEDCKDEL